MSQRITPTIQTELRNPHLRKVEFVRIDFPSGVVRAHSRIGDLQWTHPVHGAETYTGVGDVGAVSAFLICKVTDTVTTEVLDSNTCAITSVHIDGDL